MTNPPKANPPELRDGRDPDPTKRPPFDYHSCWKCRDGEKPCPFQKPGFEYLCEYPHARND